MVNEFTIFYDYQYKTTNNYKGYDNCHNNKPKGFEKYQRQQDAKNYNFKKIVD